MQTKTSSAKFAVGWNEATDKHIAGECEFDHPFADSLDDIIAYYDGDDMRLVEFWNAAIQEVMKKALYSQKMQEHRPVDKIKARENAIMQLTRLGFARKDAETTVDDQLKARGLN